MKCLLSYCLLFCLFACSDSANQASPTADSAATGGAWKVTELTPEQIATNRQHYYVWDVNAETRTIKVNPMLQPSYFHVDTLIAGLNEKFPEIALTKRQISGDTLYAAIKDASYLTERMGSAGAEQYIAYAVLNLTSVEGINFVRIDFPEGSHAAPDVWAREAFKEYKEASAQLPE